MAFNPYPNLSGQVNLVAPNRSVTTPGRRPLADVSVVGEAYRNFGQVISNLGGQAAELALRAKLDDERLAHDEASLAFASSLNQHEMDMRNNPQTYANMKYEDMQSSYMGTFGPEGTLIGSIIKPYDDKPKLQKSIKNTLTQMGLRSASTAFRIHSGYREQQIETKVNAFAKNIRNQMFIAAQGHFEEKGGETEELIKGYGEQLNQFLAPYKTLTDSAKEKIREYTIQGSADGALIAHRNRLSDPRKYLEFLNNKDGPSKKILETASYDAVTSAYQYAISGTANLDQKEEASAQKALLIRTLSTVDGNPSAIIQHTLDENGLVKKQSDRRKSYFDNKNDEYNMFLFHELPDAVIQQAVNSYKKAISTGSEFKGADLKRFNDYNATVVNALKDSLRALTEGQGEDPIPLLEKLRSIRVRMATTSNDPEINPFVDKNGNWKGGEKSKLEAVALQNYLDWFSPILEKLAGLDGGELTREELLDEISKLRGQNLHIFTTDLKDVLVANEATGLTELAINLAHKKLGTYEDPNEKFHEIGSTNLDFGQPALYDPNSFEPVSVGPILQELKRVLPDTDLTNVNLYPDNKIETLKEIMRSGNKERLKQLVTQDLERSIGASYMPQLQRQLMDNPETEALAAILSLGYGVDRNDKRVFSKWNNYQWTLASQILANAHLYNNISKSKFLTTAKEINDQWGFTGIDDSGREAQSQLKLLALAGRMQYGTGDYTGYFEGGEEQATKDAWKALYSHFQFIKRNNTASASDETTILFLTDQLKRLDIDPSIALDGLTQTEKSLQQDILLNPNDYVIVTEDSVMDGNELNKKRRDVLQDGGSLDFAFRNVTRNNVSGIALSVMQKGKNGKGYTIGWVYKGNPENYNETDQNGITFYKGDSLDRLVALPILISVADKFNERASGYFAETDLGPLTIPFPWSGEEYPTKIENPIDYQMWQSSYARLQKYEDPDEMQKIINAYNAKSPSDAKSHAGHGSFIKSLGNLWGDDGLLEYMMHKDFMAYVNEYMLSEDLLYVDRSSTGVEHVHMLLPDDNFVLDGKTILGMHSLHDKWVSSLKKGDTGWLEETLSAILGASPQNLNYKLMEVFDGLSLGVNPHNIRVIPHDATPDAMLMRNLSDGAKDWLLHKKDIKSWQKAKANLVTNVLKSSEGMLPKRTWKKRRRRFPVKEGE